MIRFECDYAEGAHSKIMEVLLATNEEQSEGYGTDRHCENARNLIRTACQKEEAEVHFVMGGTQANLIVISALLRSFQGVITAHTGHINVHETGAIEATGHKVLATHSSNGKLTAQQIQKTLEEHWEDANHEHMVQPGMVYLSNPTEAGTIYTKEELVEIKNVCHRFNIPLYMDGARLGYALASEHNDLSLADIASLCDVFYIGGTKVGALFGEAIVITNEALMKDFRYQIKQKGGMLAKGRLLGIQFETLFEQDLYIQIAKNAVDHALNIKRALQEKNIKFQIDSVTNQQFPILNASQIKKLSENYAFQIWEKLDEENTVIRICTSWATKDEQVQMLIKDIKGLSC